MARGGPPPCSPHDPSAIVARAPSQEKLNTPQKLKRYLEDNGVTVTPDSSTKYLRCMAKKHMAKLRMADSTPEQRRAEFKGDYGISIKQVTKIVEEKRAIGAADTEWLTVKCVLTNVSPDIVKVKHEVGSTASCRGLVRNGVCSRCKQSTAGVIGYSFQAILADLDDETVSITVACAEKAGDALFDMTASSFSKLSEATATAKAGDLLYEPYAFTLKIEYDAGKNEVVLIGGQFNRLPHTVLQD